MKALLALLLVGKFGKVLVTGGTMLVSLFAYAVAFGWRYALAIVGLIFIHEAGHFVAARNRGLDVGAPVFIPFVGAWISLKNSRLDPETQAYVGIAGPILGSAAAFGCYLIALENGQRLWMAIAYVGFVLNLFNLLPLPPLDGGKVVAVISAKIWLAGLPILLALFLWQPSPLLLILAVLALPQVWSLFADQEALAQVPVVSRAVRFRYGIQYIALAAGLAILAFDAHERMT